jgi:hypothetical protein
MLRRLGRWTLGLLLLGIAWRLTRYFLRFPVWGDECMIATNFLDQTYLGLTGKLRCHQVAPLLFLWGEFAVFLHLGSSELSLRLLPLLSGLGGLLLFCRLTYLVLSPLARTLAIGFLAVAIWPTSMCTLIKPYALDLLMGAALVVAAVEWLKQPQRTGWLLGLSALVPVAIFGSYPAVFVAGGVSLALLVPAWRGGGRARVYFALYNLSLLGAFLANYLVVGQAQMDRETGAVHTFMQSYWADGFPPTRPLAFFKWLVLIHTGRLMAYPIGGSNGLSAATFGLFLAGLWMLARGRQWALVTLCVCPFALGLVAAFAGGYPYGGCCRLSQHVAPIVCLLAGAGGAGLIQCLRSAEAQRRGAAIACGLLALAGAIGLLCDVVRPYRGECDLWTARLVRQIVARSGPDDQIVALNDEAMTDIVFRWELDQFRLKGGWLGWKAAVNRDRLDQASQVWVLNISAEAPGLSIVQECLAHNSRQWVLADQVPFAMIPTRKKDPLQRCEVYRWIPADHLGVAGSVKPVSVWP